MPEDLDGRLATPHVEERSLYQRVFHGPYGLRAGWSLLIFLSPFILLFIASKLVMHFVPQPQPARPVHKAAEMQPHIVLVTHGLPLALFAGLSWLMSRIERRPFSVFGFRSPRPVADCVKGLLTGVAALSLLVALLHASHLLVFEGFAVTGTTALLYALKWMAAFCLVGLAEEFMFRGYLQYTLTRGLSGLLPPSNRFRRDLGFWIAAVVLSALFLQGHKSNPGESPVGLLAVFLAGMVLAYSLWHTGSLWWAIGFHASWDWAQSFLYGVGDSGTFSQGRLLHTHPAGNPLYSGGATGPEGSLFVLPVLILIAVVVRFTVPRRPPPPLVP